MKYSILFSLISWGLVGCTSASFRAPVSDLTLNANPTLNTNEKSPSKVQKSSTKSVSTENYKVKKGDTLYSIAWKMGMDVKTLAEMNKIKSPYIIYENQMLTLNDKGIYKFNMSPRVFPEIKPPSQKVVKKQSNTPLNQQKVKKKLVSKNTKEYPANNSNGKVNKTVSKTEKVKQISPATKKISNWGWPAKGKVIKSFSASQAGMKGISIANQHGAPIYAAAAGQVVYAGNGLQGYGNLVIIKHNYDYLSAYAHNDKLLVHENEKIKKGQKIATMGDSGTDSVHLHFEIRYQGKSVDPLRYLEKR